MFEKTESRGHDASGYWGTEVGATGRIFYHKEPTRSSIFVKKEIWQKLGKHTLDLLLVHARAASQGVGEPACNNNNHPFVSVDRTTALCHNGRIHDHDYRFLSKKYQVSSKCDSEILLRIFEAASHYKVEDLAKEYVGVNQQLLHPIAGISDIFSYANDGHMAVSIGERSPDGRRQLWLFRNMFRPLWVVDLRNVLGQIFFFSEPRIWEDAMKECYKLEDGLLANRKLIELVPEQIWSFTLDASRAEPIEVQRFEVLKENDYLPYVVEDQIKIIHKPTPCEIVSRIEDDDVEPPKLYGGDFDTLETISVNGRLLRQIVREIESKALELSQHYSLEQRTADEIAAALGNCYKNLQTVATKLESEA